MIGKKKYCVILMKMIISASRKRWSFFLASPATIRRDFTELAASGKAERVRGALRKIASESGKMPPFALREIRLSKEKAAMAEFAVTLLKPGDVLIIDGGTSTFQMAHFLPDFSLKIITNSVRLAMFLDGKVFRQKQSGNLSYRRLSVS